MNEERPIVFTISSGAVWYRISTKDTRGFSCIRENVSPRGLFRTMTNISQILNDLGYAVLFEVD